ncbi:MAG: hypothetical protein ABSF84_15705 [Acidimicrobiales bacterium]
MRGDRIRAPRVWVCSTPMKKLIILIVIIALGAVAAQRLRSA